MSHEKFLALDLVAQLAERFGPGSKVAQEVPDWIEYLTNVECPERPRTRPGAPWWGKIRSLLPICDRRPMLILPGGTKALPVKLISSRSVIGSVGLEGFRPCHMNRPMGALHEASQGQGGYNASITLR